MEVTSSAKGGWPLHEWLPLAGMARPTFYTIPEQQRPASVKIGRKVIITEAPAAWLERVRQDGGVTLQRKKRSPAEQQGA